MYGKRKYARRVLRNGTPNGQSVPRVRRAPKKISEEEVRLLRHYHSIFIRRGPPPDADYKSWSGEKRREKALSIAENSVELAIVDSRLYVAVLLKGELWDIYPEGARGIPKELKQGLESLPHEEKDG